jgi:exo-beta-1,3-glucanase (GH17 family)
MAVNAGTFATQLLNQIEAACPEKPSYNLESGWPSAGASNGVSLANIDSQATAIYSIVAAMGNKTVMFSFRDDSWEPKGVEQHFGCAKLFPNQWR